MGLGKFFFFFFWGGWGKGRGGKGDVCIMGSTSTRRVSPFLQEDSNPTYAVYMGKISFFLRSE